MKKIDVDMPYGTLGVRYKLSPLLMDFAEMEGMLPGLFEGGGLGDMCDCLRGGLGDV